MRGNRSLLSSVETLETLIFRLIGATEERGLGSLFPAASLVREFLSYQAKSPRNRKFSTGGGGGERPQLGRRSHRLALCRAGASEAQVPVCGFL